ncbi:MAG: alkaline phosphatase [Desulfuromonadales bacterium C00003094]|nr:MAG: alkaline phosphatase [Desulfuromonadales bacterium C00003094]
MLLPPFRWLLMIVLICTGSVASAATTVPTKNVIIMISDGMGYNHSEAASFYASGRKNSQAYTGFPVRLAMSTHAVTGGYDGELIWSRFPEALKGATDSAAAATAIASGQKTYRGTIGMVPGEDGTLRPVENLVERAEKLGKASGLVTSVPFAHATPAAFVVHNPKRKNFLEISTDMLRDSALEVLIGCGHPFYDRNGRQLNAARTFKSVGDKDTWMALQAGTLGGDADGDGQVDPWSLIERRTDFQKLAVGPTPQRLLGIPQVAKTLQQGRSGDPHARPYAVPLLTTVPNLTELTRAALNVLDNDPDGLFLMIEGGAVDWASHDNQSGRMLEEQLDFDRTVAAVVRWVETHSSWDETLLIVTGDHETGYLTGPGSDPDWQPLVNRGRNQLPGMEWHSDYHTNSLIPLYAKGRGSERLLRMVQGHDPVRGSYVDNTAVGKAGFAAFE